MKVKDLITRLAMQDQNENVFVELIEYTETVRRITSAEIHDVTGIAGGSIYKKDNKFYGVIIKCVA
jgi:hypothetical protein